MGNYAANLSKRINQAKITEGYCLICNKYEHLTFDHVPPQGTFFLKKIEQKLISEVYPHVQPDTKGLKSRNGSKFRTICKTCNSSLGLFDSELSRINKNLTPLITNYFQNPFSYPAPISIDVNAIHFAKGMIGHILSATTIEECEAPSGFQPYFQPLKDFVLGVNENIRNTHDIYYWFYPYSRHLSAKIVNFFNEGNSSLVSLLSFFPIAFLLTEKGKGIYPAQAFKFDLDSPKLYINCSLSNREFINFPFVPLKGNQMCLLPDNSCIVSYPIKAV